MWKRILAASSLGLVVVVSIWATLVVSYEADRGTANTVVVSYVPSSTVGSSDHLATLAFDGEAENLSWGSLEVALEINGVSHKCGFGQQSIPSDEGALVQPKLGADGQTFTTVVDATDEESFTFLSVPEQQRSGEDQYTMRFSSTDVFLADGVKWAFVENVAFTDLTSTRDVEFSNDTSERLSWYEYDFAVHRITPLEGVYVFRVDNVDYKVQFVSYYNADDERRYPTMQIAAFDPTSFPALSNPDLVSPAPCLVVAGDTDLTQWSFNETIELHENGFELRSGEEAMVLSIRYEDVEVRIVQNPLSTTEG